MQKKFLAGLAMGLIAFVMIGAGAVQATLTTIGTATYNGSDYKLIWESDNNGNSLIWLDYTNGPATLSQQMYDWAPNLDGALTYHIYSAYTVTWDESAWRLPTTAGGYTYDEVSTGYDGSYVAGYNITSSEMGHLYYAELGNLGKYSTDGDLQTGYGLTNTGDFEHLVEGIYFSSTEYPRWAHAVWVFDMSDGLQAIGYTQTWNYHPILQNALAVRNGEVTTGSTSSVPVPATILLFATGLAGLVGWRQIFCG